MPELKLGFIGNPNCGKTTLFNAYTGAKLKVANWPGVTVEKKEGNFTYHKHEFALVDLPGIYSLTSYTMEEKVSREYIMSDDVDVIVDVADASALERNLYLTLQLIELGKPVILALNMMDIVEERGMEIDLHRLPEMLGIPVIPVSARKKTGLEVLMHAALHHKDKTTLDPLIHEHTNQSNHIHNHHEEYAMVYSDEIEDKIDLVIERLKESYPKLNNYRWHAIKLLEQDETVKGQLAKAELSDIISRSYEEQIINEKYDFIEEIIEECLVNKKKQAAFTDRIDMVLTHRYFGVPIFLVIMALVFFLTFTVGDWLKGYFEAGIELVEQGLKAMLMQIHAGELLTSLIVDGIVAGVGGILTFLPNIFILFLALAFLEDSGYMSRVAYVMDSIMGWVGLSGRAFIPMLLGFGCTVPAIMASRALENKRDRYKTILITPFMSCSARLPIYVIFSSMFFEKNAMLVAYSLYVIGIVVALITAVVLHWTERKKEANMLLIELPEYKTPNARSIAIYVWTKVKDYITKAGTTIFIASIIVWALLNFGPHGLVSDMSDSFASIAGRVLVPVFTPIGLGYWQIIVALISGIAAKEIVVSSTSVLFGISNINSAEGMSSMVAALGAMGFGSVNAYAFMVFCLLYVPCAASLATIRKETESTRFMLGAMLFQLLVAWVAAFLVFQVGGKFF